MQRVITSVAWVGVGACLQQPTFVAITPDYGYVDGCADVVLSGHHLGTDATAQIGGAEMEVAPAEEDPSLPEWAQDVGFEYTGVTPPGEEGFADVALIVDGERLVLPEGFFYQACPASFQVNAVSTAAGDTTPALAEGDEVSLSGCGLSDDVTVRVMEYAKGRAATDACGAAASEVATAALTSACGTAQASFALPALPDGAYALWFEHSGSCAWLLEGFKGLGHYSITDPNYYDEAGWYGYLPYHSFHAIKLNGSYTAPFGTTFGLVYEFDSGHAWQKRSFVPFYGYDAFGQGRGSRMMPSVHYVDVRVAHTFRFSEDQSLEATIDVFNLPGLATAITRFENDAPGFGSTLFRQAPRSVRFGLKFRY